jgi:uncharacterized protein YkwD
MNRSRLPAAEVAGFRRRYISAIVLASSAVLFAPSIAAARDPTNDEQYMLELINRMRTNPAGELHELVNINLGPPATWQNPRSDNPDVASALTFFNVNAGTLVTQWNMLTPAPPLAWNGALGQSAQTYSNLMIANNQQSHNLDGRTLLARFQASGYVFSGGGSAAENIFAAARSPFQAHAAFAIDWGNNPPSGIQNPPGHRNAIMNATYREIGVGIVNDTSANTNTGPLVVTQHFARSNNDGPFLTGVVYEDDDSNDFYTPGEGLGGISIVAMRQPGGQAFSTTSFASGGYSLELAAGTYNILASGPGMTPITLSGIAVGTVNVKRDFLATTLVPGDIDLDGDVDRRDGALFAVHYGRRAGSTWATGDFNGDMRTTLADWALLQSHLGQGGSAAAVPEPSSAALASLIALAAGLTFRRNRR